MSTTATSTRVFRTGSRTFFVSSLFFPKDVKQDVFDLYAFVRVADDFVDAIPAQIAEYNTFKSRYYAAVAGTPSGDEIIDRFVDLQRRASFEQSWIDAFFVSMSMDAVPQLVCQTMQDTERYMYGSAEVIGLMMCRIMKLERAAYHSAQMLGKAFQYMNMIRDIGEDQERSRQYIPQESVVSSGLPDLSQKTAESYLQQFQQMIRSEVARYREWDAEARKGFHHIPRRYRVPIAAAADMFAWTMNQIDSNPLLVFGPKLKPSIARVVMAVAGNAVRVGK